MSNQLSFVPPVSLDALDGEIKISLPKIEDVKNPVVQKVIARIQEMKHMDASSGHKQHSSYDKTAYSSGSW